MGGPDAEEQASLRRLVRANGEPFVGDSQDEEEVLAASGRRVWLPRALGAVSVALLVVAACHARGSRRSSSDEAEVEALGSLYEAKGEYEKHEHVFCDDRYQLGATRTGLGVEKCRLLCDSQEQCACYEMYAGGGDCTIFSQCETRVHSDQGTYVEVRVGGAPAPAPVAGHADADADAESMTEPYDCEAGLDHWSSLWSTGKKTWCCGNHDKGCGGADGASFERESNGEAVHQAEYDCKEGSQITQWIGGLVGVHWSDEQTAWCCSHQNVGCDRTTQEPPSTTPAATTSAPAGGDEEAEAPKPDEGEYNCQAGDLYGTWSAGKRTWCCKQEGRGCDDQEATTTTTQPYDCSEEVLDWKFNWGQDKKAWCCQQYHLGCTTTTGPPTTTEGHDCQVELGTWQDDWSDSKKAWCCQVDGIGCSPVNAPNIELGLTTKAAHDAAPATTPAPTTSAKPAGFDCEEQVLSWATAWDSSKKDWCCAKHNVGCARQTIWVTTTVTTSHRWDPVADPYDCHSGAAESSWTDPQKKFCCEYYAMGCSEAEIVEQSAAAAATAASDQAAEGGARASEATTTAEPTTQTTTTQTTTTLHAVVIQTTPRPNEEDLYDCKAGVDTWELGWAIEKKAYCCVKHSVGCPKTTTVAVRTTVQPEAQTTASAGGPVETAAVETAAVPSTSNSDIWIETTGPVPVTTTVWAAWMPPSTTATTTMTLIEI